MWVTHIKELSRKEEEVCHPHTDDASARIWRHGELRTLPASPTMRSNLEQPCGRSHVDVSSLVAFAASWHSKHCPYIFRASDVRAISQALTSTGRFTCRILCGFMYKESMRFSMHEYWPQWPPSSSAIAATTRRDTIPDFFCDSAITRMV